MKTEELDFDLPKELIAQAPISPRDTSQLLVLNRKTGEITDAVFRDIVDFLNPGDVLVFNKTKVFPARVFATKESGGKVEVVFLSEIKPKVWEVIIGGKVSPGQGINFGENFFGEIIKDQEDSRLIKVNLPQNEVFETLEKIGHVPLPPYIKRSDNQNDKKEYQTVFAKKTGSAAAPTAGLHFTKELLAKLEDKGVEIEYLTLHVGLGTFAPVKTENVEEHPIHSESFEINEETAERLNEAKKDGRRIIAVGTTVVRSLESAFSDGELKPQKRTTNLFIFPGFNFQVIDGMVTNFHTPKSSLLALVFAFAGQENIQAAYKHAISKKYRFFSYGDGMIII